MRARPAGVMACSVPSLLSPQKKPKGHSHSLNKRPNRGRSWRLAGASVAEAPITRERGGAGGRGAPPGGAGVAFARRPPARAAAKLPERQRVHSAARGEFGKQKRFLTGRRVLSGPAPAKRWHGCSGGHTRHLLAAARGGGGGGGGGLRFSERRRRALENAPLGTTSYTCRLTVTGFLGG